MALAATGIVLTKTSVSREIKIKWNLIRQQQVAGLILINQLSDFSIIVLNPCVNLRQLSVSITKG